MCYSFSFNSTQKKKRSRGKVEKTNKSPYIEPALEIDQIRKHHVIMTKKEVYIKKEMQLQNHFSNFIHKMKHFFRLTSFYLVHSRLTTLLLPYAKYFVRTIWTLPMPRQIWTISLVQNGFQLLGCKIQNH